RARRLVARCRVDLPARGPAGDARGRPELAAGDLRRRAGGGRDAERRRQPSESDGEEGHGVSVVEGAGGGAPRVDPPLRRSAIRLARLQARLPILQVLALAAVYGYGVATLPGLASWESTKTILVISSLVGVASLGQTLVILIGGFDLSLPSFMVATA